MKSYSQFVTESNEVTTSIVEEVYQDLLDSGYTEEQISESYYFYEHLVEEGLITENPLAGLAKLGGRVLPGVGAGLYGYDAIQRARKGDWGGAALQGLGAGLSLVPGVGTLGALAPAAINMATDAMGLTGDKSKGQPGYKPPTASTPSAPAASTPSSSAPAAPKNTSVLALKGGVQGRLDKATGKFTPGDFSDAEKARYTAAGGKIPSAAPKPTTPTTAKTGGPGDKVPTASGVPTQGPANAKIDPASVQAALKRANSPAVLNKPAPVGSALAKQQAMNKPNALGNTPAKQTPTTAKMSPRTQRILSGQSVYNRDPLARGTR